MKTYPNNDKAMYLERMRAHRAADELVQGTGWDGKRGCSVGCTVHCYNHAEYARLIGVPEWIARLQDEIFEALPKDEALIWPERFLSAIPIGADLDPMWPQFAARMLTRYLGYIGNGKEMWRIRCRTAVKNTIDSLKSDSERLAVSAESAAWEARAARAARADSAARAERRFQADDLIELIKQSAAVAAV